MRRHGAGALVGRQRCAKTERRGDVTPRATAAGGAVPWSMPLCRVNGGRPCGARGPGWVTACGRAGPDGGALRAQVRPGGRGVAGAVGALRARVPAEGSPERGVGSGAVASGAALGLVRRAAAAAERARARVWGAGQGRPGGAREQRGRRPSARGRRREGKGKREKEKKRERKWKKKKKKKRRGERREKGKREGGIRAGITALIAEPVGHARRPGARERDAQVEGK